MSDGRKVERKLVVSDQAEDTLERVDGGPWRVVHTEYRRASTAPGFVVWNDGTTSGRRGKEEDDGGTR